MSCLLCSPNKSNLCCTSSFQRLNVAIQSATRILVFCPYRSRHPFPFAGSSYGYAFFFFLSWFQLHFFPYLYVILHPIITHSITRARISPSLSPRAATVPNSQLGQRGWEEAQMLVRPEQGRPAPALSLPCAAPTLMSKRRMWWGRKNRNYFGVWGMPGAELKEPLSSSFYREDAHMLSCLATHGEQSLVSGNQKMTSFSREKALQTSLFASPSPTWFPVLGKDEGSKWATKSF